MTHMFCKDCWLNADCAVMPTEAMELSNDTAKLYQTAFGSFIQGFLDSRALDDPKQFAITLLLDPGF